jgi:hypothetical protein
VDWDPTLQNLPAGHDPAHALPHPSGSPHALPAQSGVQLAQVWVCGVQTLPCWVQSTHAVPEWPHEVSTSLPAQCPSAVQQSGHVPTLQAWHEPPWAGTPWSAMHAGPPTGHATHACPAEPHTASSTPGWQIPCPSQHPLGHEDALHWLVLVQAPSAIEQNWPAPHGPVHREPQPSGVPQLLPAQSGTQTVQGPPFIVHVLHELVVPLSKQEAQVPVPGPVTSLPPHGTP